MKSNPLNINYNLDAVKDLIKEINPDKIFVLCDSNTKIHCYSKVEHYLDGTHEIIVVPAGEEFKNIYTCQTIWSWLSDKNASTKSLLLILGGGVACDLGGFSATTFKRGINFILIPTTLLAMADASIGGKVGINFRNTKNELGAFNEAFATVIDTRFLETLDENEILSGFAEIVKHALIADKELWITLSKAGLGRKNITTDLIRKAVEIKQVIVQKDPYDKGERRLLNFGHTLGHAFESVLLNEKKTIPHGFAVVAGIICESNISRNLNLLSDEELHEITTFILKNYELKMLKGIKPEQVLSFVYKDKKNEQSQILITLLNGIGKSSYNNNIDKEAIIKSIAFLESLI